MEDVFGDDLVAFGGGVGAVGLHHSIYAVDVLEEEGQERDVVLPGEQGVGLLELLDVVGTVVGGEADAGEGEPDAAGFEAGEDGVEVGARVVDAEAAKAVVAAELDDDESGVEGDDVVDAVEAVLGGVAADAFVDDAIVLALLVEVFLEEVGVALAGVSAVAGGEAVPEADEEGAVVGGGGSAGGGGVWSGGCDGTNIGGVVFDVVCAAADGADCCH